MTVLLSIVTTNCQAGFERELTEPSLTKSECFQGSVLPKAL